MIQFIRDFLLAFVPIFVAVDIVGVLPLYLALTEGLDPQERRKVVWQSLLTAMVIATAFIFLGKAIFALLGIPSMLISTPTVLGTKTFFSVAISHPASLSSWSM